MDQHSSFFFFEKGKLLLKGGCSLRAVALGVSLRSVRAAVAMQSVPVLCSRQALSFSPALRVALPWPHPLPGGSARMSALPAPSLWPCRRAPFETPEESENSPEAYHSLSFCFRSFLLPVKSFYSTFSLLFFFPEMHYLAGARVLRISLFLWCLVLCFNSLDSSSSLLTSHPSWSTGR